MASRFFVFDDRENHRAGPSTSMTRSWSQHRNEHWIGVDLKGFLFRAIRDSACGVTALRSVIALRALSRGERFVRIEDGRGRKSGEVGGSVARLHRTDFAWMGRYDPDAGLSTKSMMPVVVLPPIRIVPWRLADNVVGRNLRERQGR